MQNRQSDNKLTKQVRIDTGYHKLLKVKAAKSGMTIKSFLEGYLSELLTVEEGNEGNISTIEYFKNKFKKEKGQEDLDF